MRQHYLTVVRDNDIRVEQVMHRQVLDEASPYFGGFRDPFDLVEAKYAIYNTMLMITAYVTPESRFKDSSALYERILAGFVFIKSVQHEDGSFDFNDCNFHSAPDTSFCIKRMLPVYCLLQRDFPGSPDIARILNIMKPIILDAAESVKHGGFHTPNHRWAIASALCMCTKVFGDPSFADSAKRYLDEGIDCNEDGEYTERSAGNYNRVTNNALIMLAAAVGDDSYCEHVIRNLRMMLTYIEPDGSIFTNNSTRQDRGKVYYPTDYYFEYLYIGHRFNIPEFLDAANYIFALCDRLGILHQDCAAEFMLLPELIGFEHTGCGIPSEYRRFYTDSNIIRARSGRLSYSVISGCSSFLYFRSGSLTCGFKLGASFFEHRAFIPERLEALRPDGTPADAAYIGSDVPVVFRLFQKMEGRYNLPFADKPATSDWHKMDHSNRGTVPGTDMFFEITVTPVSDGIDLGLNVYGTENAPFRLELSFDPGCRAESEHFIAEGHAGAGMVAKDGTLTVTKGNDAIELGPCFGTHNFTAGKFGSEPRNPECFTVYLTDITPFEHKLRIRALPASY